MTHPEYAPGDVVETSYGVGVVTNCPTEERNIFRILLWRIPGKSIGSSSIAYLQPNAVSALFYFHFHFMNESKNFANDSGRVLHLSMAQLITSDEFLLYRFTKNYLRLLE